MGTSKSAEIQAFLFYYGDPISKGKLANHLKIKESECAEALSVLAGELKNNPNSGLVILENGNDVQLTTKPSLAGFAEKLIREEFREELTPAALETLSIIAYLGPVPRSTIDYIRGVNSSFIIRNLMVRGLVEKNEEKTKGNIYYYGISFAFLSHLGIEKQDNLPEFDKYRALLSSFETQLGSTDSPVGQSINQ